MSIRIHLNESTGMYYPILRCSYSDEVIERPSLGNYCWQVDENGKPVTETIWHIKKCYQREFEKDNKLPKGHHWYCLELKNMWKDMFDDEPEEQVVADKEVDISLDDDLFNPDGVYSLNKRFPK